MPINPNSTGRASDPWGTRVNTQVGTPRLGMGQVGDVNAGGQALNPNGGGMNPGSAQKDWNWSDYFKEQFGNLSDAPAFSTTNQDQARILQQQAMQQLQAQAAGTYDTRAQQELAQQNKLAQQGQYAIASSQRGALGRQAAQGAGQVQGALAGQSEMLRLQEQQAAQAMLAQMYAQQQAQDLAQAQGMAQTNLQGQALNDAMQQFYAGQGGNLAIEQTGIQGERNLADLGLDLERNALTGSYINKGIQGLGTGLETMSQMNWNSNGGRDGTTTAPGLRTTDYNDEFYVPAGGR